MILASLKPNTLPQRTHSYVRRFLKVLYISQQIHSLPDSHHRSGTNNIAELNHTTFEYTFN
jgi:hypothetical protein